MSNIFLIRIHNNKTKNYLKLQNDIKILKGNEIYNRMLSIINYNVQIVKNEFLNGDIIDNEIILE